MSLEFEKAILKAVEEGKRAAADFDQSWRSAREGVFKLLESGANALSQAFEDSGGGAHAVRENDNGVTLYASRYRTGEHEYALSFVADGQRREIVCSCNPPFAPPERLTLDNLGQEYVQRRVVEFARAVAEGRINGWYLA